MGLSVFEEQHNGMTLTLMLGEFAFIALLTHSIVILQEIKNITQQDVRDRLPLFIPYRPTAILTTPSGNV